jgi:hypothetical protein
MPNQEPTFGKYNLEVEAIKSLDYWFNLVLSCSVVL